MRNNRVLKSHDVVVLCKLITSKQWPTQIEIANTLELSQAEISHSLKTLNQVGLISSAEKRINKLAVSEFFIHAIKFFFPVEKNGIGRGFKIGPSHTVFREKVHSDEYDYIWSNPEGSSKGIIVTPLLQNLSKRIVEDERLFLLLNVVEIFRGLGGVRHQQEAGKLLKELLK